MRINTGSAMLCYQGSEKQTIQLLKQQYEKFDLATREYDDLGAHCLLEYESRLQSID